MKCKNCDGTGICYNFVEVDGGIINRAEDCSVCHGTGEVEQTKEEWLRSATFEEMAGTLYEWYSQGHIEGKVGKQLSSVTRVVEWLKEKHNGNI